MKGWALWLSLAAFLTVLARSFLDWAYVFREFTDMSTAGAAAGPMVGYLAMFALWLWALVAAVRGTRGGLIGMLAFNVFTAVAWGLGTVIALCPTPCGTVPPLSDVVIWANVLIGAAAAFAVWRQLR